jgi:mono/diheme cytochrome c family protein
MRVSARSTSAAAVSTFLAVLLLGPALASGQTQTSGKDLFDSHCAACHSLGSERIVGPGLEGVTQRRSRAWLSSFISDPERMVAEKDPIALELKAKYEISMPNLKLSGAQIDLILGYLQNVGSIAPEAVAEAAPAPPRGDAAIGRQLFIGERRFANGGPACIACHSVPGFGALGGGTLARDLTGAAGSYGSGLAQVLQAPPFPVMKQVFSIRPLTAAEVADLAAFLTSLSQRPPSAPSQLLFLFAGTAGLLPLVALGAVFWRGRLRGVRKTLIGEHE